MREVPTVGCRRPPVSPSIPTENSRSRTGAPRSSHRRCPIASPTWVTAAYITGTFVVIGVCGFYLWRRQHVEFARAGFSVAMWMALVLTPPQILLGDQHGLNTLQHQPIKVAAMEGDWETR